MNQKQCYRVMWLVVAAMTGALVSADARAQESGTLLSQALTMRKATTDPSIGITVAGGATGKGLNTTTKVIIDIGAEGNAVSLPPDPALPGSFLFRVRQTGVATAIDFPTTGGTNVTTFANKAVAVVHGLENPADPRGLYAIAIVHLTGVAAGATETYTLELVGLPAGLRVVASIDQGTFTTLNTTGACGGSCPPCPGVCPVGQACRSPCQRCPVKVPAGPINFCEMPQFKYPPGPWPPCLSCPREWFTDFDRSQFERVMVSFRPTDEQRTILERPGQADLFRFDVTGGRTIGGMLEGASGEFIQLVEYTKGQTPTVAANVAGVRLAQFRAEPTGGVVREGDNLQKVLYGLGGLILGALGSALGLRRRRGSPGSDQKP